MSNRFIINQNNTCSLHYDNLTPEQMVTVGERLISNATFLKRKRASHQKTACEVIAETLTLDDDEFVSFRTFYGMGNKPVKIQTSEWDSFVEALEEVPKIALNGKGILVDGVYSWRTNWSPNATGPIWIRVSAEEWDDFIRFMKQVGKSF